MYTNIKSDHGIAAFNTWFTKYESELPEDFPMEFFMKILQTVMNNNVFTFGDTYD